MKIFIDENMPPQLAEGLNILEKPNKDDCEVLSIKKEFGEGVKDEEWIPLVGNLKGIVITSDYNIHRKKSQKQLYIENGVGLIFIKPPSKNGLKYWEMVELTISRWTEFKSHSRKIATPFAIKCPIRGGKIEIIS